MSNKYNSDNSAIIDSTGKEWPVETAHELPLPEGITVTPEPNGSSYSVLFGVTSAKGYQWEPNRFSTSTHWLARRPLPEVPRVKTQDELDEEAFETYWEKGRDANKAAECLHRLTWTRAIAYARQCPAKPAA